MENAVMTVEQSGGELSLGRPPETVLKEADMVVAPWSKRVEALQLYKTISGRKHLLIEAWQMLAAMWRVTARIRETRYVEMGEVRGYEAVAEAYHIPTGQVISTAEAMCLSDEENWGPRPKYEYVEGKKTAVGFAQTPLQQLRSMAQTRACSKVHSNLFKWVVVQKGYAGTPAEEMTGHEYDGDPQAPPPQRKSAPPQQQPQQPPQQQSEGGAPAGGNGHLISPAQAKRMWAIGFGIARSKEDIIAVIKSFGFERADAITSDKYEAICNAIAAGKE